MPYPATVMSRAALVFGLGLCAACGETTAPLVKPDATPATLYDGGVINVRDAGPRDAGEAAERDGGDLLRDGGDLPNRDGGAPPDRDGGMPPTIDPVAPGPYTATAFVATIRATSRNDVVLRCELPSGGPTTAPYPTVLVLHGFRIPADQYDGYVTHFVSHGYVACTADFEASFVANHAQNASDIVETIDWLFDQTTDNTHELFGLIDDTRVALVGHSLGGKVAVLAAAADSRVAAVVALDPVDTSMLCDSMRCPDASDMLPLPIPMVFFGETIDGTPGVGGQACAPTADNYATFYTRAQSPAVEVTVLGANHMSFIDDPDGCGLVCSFCQTATANQTDVLTMTRAIAVAFLERHLRGVPAFDRFIDGREADTRWIQPSHIAVSVK